MSESLNTRIEWAGMPIWDVKSKSPTLSRYLTWIIFLLLLFEGCLRKWAFPEYHRYLFFIRDPFLILLYYLNRNIFSQFLMHPVGKFFYLITLFPIVSLPFHPMDHPDWFLFILYGYRNYCLYIPLPFIIAYIFTKDDLKNIVLFSLALTVPVAVLTHAQSLASPTDPINQGFGSDPDTAFGSLVVSQGFFRTAGLFTSIEGHVYFIGMLAAILFSVFISKEINVPRLFFWLSVVSFCVILGVSGSRTAFTVVFIILVISQLAGVFVLRKMEALKAFSAPIMFSLLCFFLVTSFFQVQAGAFSERVLNTSEITGSRFFWLDDLFQRVSTDLDTMGIFLDISPIMGYGFGYGGNAGWMLNVPVVAEFPIGRHIIDLGPLLGPLYYLFRLWWLYFLGRGVLQILKRNGNPFPLFYFGVVAIIFSWGQLTNQGSTLGFGWILSGFCLAYCVLAAREVHATGNSYESR